MRNYMNGNGDPVTPEMIAKFKAKSAYDGPLPKSFERIRHLLVDFSDERGMDSGYWLYLRAPLINDMDEVHFVHEDTVAECLSKMNLKNIRICGCDECRQMLADGQEG